MKLKIISTTIILTLAVLSYGQQQYCADSSFRVKYIFGNTGATLYNNPGTAGKNIFTGGFTEGLNGGLALMKTTWGDSIIWAKKIYMNGGSLNSFNAPGGTFICTGNFGGLFSANNEMLISRIDTNGNILWMNRFSFAYGHILYNVGNLTTKNILVVNNAIYFTAVFNYYNAVVAKLNLDGNIIWSKGFWMNPPSSSIITSIPVYYNNTVLFYGVFNSVIILNKLSDANGSLIESVVFKTLPHNLIKGFFPREIKYNTDNSLSLTGLVGIDNFGTIVPSDFIFNTLLDTNLNPVHNYYFTHNFLLDGQDIFFDFNNKKQHAVLSSNPFNLNDKYFITFGKDDKVLRSRKFIIPANFSSISRKSVNLDDKENLHFVFHYPQGTQQVTEYARISNFAPNGTLGCFGKDTSILTQDSFNISKLPFTWDNIYNDAVTSNNVAYTEDTAIVTKELVCKLVSICDSLKITGPTKVCTNQPVRYSFIKNRQCLKVRQWVIDTSYINILNNEADSAFTISFKKPFAGFIKANIYTCVVQDSLFVTASTPKPAISFVNRDSLLCPGKKIVLKAKPGFINYLWQDGSTADSLRVTTAGFYKVTGTDSCGFRTADSIAVNNSDTSLILPATQTICKYDTAYITLPNDVNNITWQPFINTLLNNKTLKAYPIQNTIYTITAERQPNCPITKTSTVVIKNCTEIVFIPNAFTPNNDSHNDVYKASSFRPLQVYHLLIYNRYGQKIFETNNIAAGWDGTYKGSPQPTGGYTYRCSYQFTGGLQKSEAGYFILIR